MSRHVGSGRIALRVYTAWTAAGSRWQALSYDELHALASLRAASWAAQGVSPGAVVCIVLPFGVECVVSLLAALRLGACPSLLEPGGPDYLVRRLDALAPQHVVTEPIHIPTLGPFADRVLGTCPGGHVPRADSHWYRPDERCAALFSPLRRAPHVPVPVRAEALYLGALRDGAVTLALRPGDHLAAPGFDTLQHQPALLFSALLMGATYVHLAADEVLRDPLVLEAFALRSVGLGAVVAGALLRTRAIHQPRWAHVFRNPEEPTDWESWRALIETVGLGDTPMANVLIEAASGGALLCSPHRPGKAHLATLMNVVPAAGRPWRLLDFTGSGQPAVGDVGVFATDDAPTEPRHIVLARRHGGEYLYGGTTEPRRSGRTYPVAEVLAALADCPFLQGTDVVAVPAGGPTVEYRFVLLGFTGPEPQAQFDAMLAPRLEELRRVLCTRLMADFLPDVIELFPCAARETDGQLDRAWCQSQYLGGSLYAKVRTPVFQRLTALRGALLHT
ncbi:AMP-binding protein [Nannocystis sp. SCPEA4]|uniref:AMP-binding protein n=1 Tax=Nannocystis sp. SCPEA4 TaxID=2996787 RepID=UPI00226FB4C4|nr:AMP-binding protein [Nannocystis sp. SCPEA4]